MINSIKHAQQLGREYGMCTEDVLMIALNACGIRNSLGTPRMRMRVKVLTQPSEVFRLILPTENNQSPFSVDRNYINCNDERFAVVTAIEDDTAVFGYFRRERSVITLNSNSRSHCTGCVFCPNTLEGAMDPPVHARRFLEDSFSALASTNNVRSMKTIREVNLSTGCFGTEEPAIEHLELVRGVLDELGCNAQIGFLTSVLRSSAAFQQLSRTVGKFRLNLTVECFERRDVILKQSKADLTLDEIPEVLQRARKSGHDTGFMYIVGLDTMDDAIRQIAALLPHLSCFPNFQVYQPHNDFMRSFAASGATSIDYYLDFRRRLEELFVTTPLRPLSWENYRPPWYFQFASEPLGGIRY